MRRTVTIALLLQFALVGCNRQNSDSAAKPRLAFVTNNAADFWSIARRGVDSARQELGDIEVEFRTNSDGSAAEQQRIVDDLLARGVDAVAISPVDPANQTRMLDAVASQAVLMTQDSDAPGSKRIVYLGTDNRAAGRQAGALILEALPAGGTIMLFVGRRDAQNAKDRIAGIEEALAGSKVTILDVRTDDTDNARAKANAADALVKVPDLAGMVGLWNYNGPAILSAVREAKREGQVQIVTFDEDDQTLAGIRDGAIHATVVQQPFEFGYRSMQMMVRLLKGDSTQVPASRQIFVPTLTIRKADVDSFTVRINRLRGRTK
jgi:ribose transport system substrate-binding protein